jgi:sugar lactone lactonase YvrE
MNDERSFERLFADRMEAERWSARLPDTFYDEFRHRAGEVRQRPRWLALIKEPPMRYSSRLAVGSPMARIAPFVLLLVALLALSVAAVGGGAAPQQDQMPATGYPSGFVPTVLAFDAEGRLYASDSFAARVYRMDPEGLTAVGGGVGAGFDGDGGPATEARTTYPYGIAFDPEGRLLLAEEGNHRVRRVDAAGVITTIAGSGLAGSGNGAFGGDGGPATEALLSEPTAIAVDAEGNIFVSDKANARVRRIGTDGIITTVAGNGDLMFSLTAGPREGEPATEVGLTPGGLALDAEGNLYVSSRADHRVFRVASDGTITTFAGTGEAGSDGDGGPATEATLTLPNSLMLDAAGNLYVSDPGANRIRMIAPDGTITTIAGTGEEGYSGDGGPATEATFALAPGDLGWAPASLAMDDSGAIYIADAGNHVIRVVDPSGTISTLEVGS